VKQSRLANTLKKTLLLVLLVTTGCKCGYSQTGKVVIQVSGVEAKKGGELAVGFFNKNNFLKAGRQSLGVTKEINGETMEIIFDRVPVGEYGIAIFQDIDRNKDLNTNFIGFPTEPMGFSNNARIRFGPPSFDDVKITVEENRTLNLIIRLR